MVATVQELEACMGAPSLPAKLKAIDHMDDHAARWIAATPLLSLIVADKSGHVRATLAGGDPGFARATAPNTLQVDTAALDRSDIAVEGDGVAALFIAPGVTETLRIAGRIANVSPSEFTIRVSECFVHCGKALIRSAFWQAQPQTKSAGLPDEARFLVLGTADAAGNTDASPKGDPAGFLTRLDDKTIALPDRTGNRRADGHRNIIAHERMALVAFAPGATQAYELSGRARLTTDKATLAPMTVENKTPLLATLIAVDEARAYDSPALARARLWDADRQSAPGRPNPAAALAAHIKLSQERGLMATATRFMITPELTERALESDYKTNLY